MWLNLDESIKNYYNNYIMSSGAENEDVKGGGIVISADYQIDCDPICLDIESRIRGTSTRWNVYGVVALERWFHLTMVWNKQQLRFFTDDEFRASGDTIHYHRSEKAGSPRGMFVGSTGSQGEFSIDELYYWDKVLGHNFHGYDYVRSAYYKLSLPGAARLTLFFINSS